MASRLPIRQTLSRLKHLPAGPKALLIEVCEHCEYVGQRSCWATNRELAERLGMSPGTVVRSLRWLAETGLLMIHHYPALGNLRELVPTLATRDAYTNGQDATPAQALLAKRHASKQP